MAKTCRLLPDVRVAFVELLLDDCYGLRRLVRHSERITLGKPWFRIETQTVPLILASSSVRMSECGVEVGFSNGDT
jgi:hypothetical protein